MLLKFLRIGLLSAASLPCAANFAPAQSIAPIHAEANPPMISLAVKERVKAARADWFRILRGEILTEFPAPGSWAAEQDRRLSNELSATPGPRRELAQRDQDQTKAYQYEIFAQSGLGALANNIDLRDMAAYGDIAALVDSGTRARDSNGKWRRFDFILKDTFKRGRPRQVLDEAGQYKQNYAAITGSSFPSGHTWDGYAAAITNALIFPERGSELFSRALQYGESRVIVQAHFPTDTIASRIGNYYALSKLLADDEITANIVTAARQVRAQLAPFCNGTLRQCLDGQATPVFDAHAAANFAVGYYGARKGADKGPLSPDLIPADAASLLRLRFPYLNRAEWRDILAGTAYPEQSLAGWFSAKGQHWGLINLPAAFQGPSFLYRSIDVNQSAGNPFDLADFGVWDIWKNDIVGPGRLTKRGDGTLILSGNNGFGGIDLAQGRLALTGHNRLAAPSWVRGGELIVNGSLLSDVTIENSGRLSGSGQLGQVTLAAGGTLAPGNSIGTLRVGDIHFKPGSRLEIEVNAAGEADRILASRQARIEGGMVWVKAGPGLYKPRSQYEILTTAQGPVTGTGFDGVSTDLAFLMPWLRYDANHVMLVLDRNDQSFCLAGASNNQCATGKAVESLRISDNPLYDRVVNLTRAQAGASFDQLSGELHASTKTALLQDSLFMRDLALNRLQKAGQTSSQANETPAAENRPEGIAAWSAGYGSWGRFSGNDNHAALKQTLGGIAIGLETAGNADWQMGLTAGYASGSVTLDQRRSKTTFDTYHIGLYGGGKWQDLALRFGANQAWHRLDSQRAMDVFGRSDKLMAEYNASTTQLYGEVSYGLHAGNLQLEPFAGLTQAWLHRDGFSETGNAAALSVAGDTMAATFSTLGLRTSAKGMLGSLPVNATAMAGWRHAEGDLAGRSRQHFAGSDPFTVSGVALARNAALVEAGITVPVAQSGLLGLSYSGSADRSMTSHAIRANLNWSF